MTPDAQRGTAPVQIWCGASSLRRASLPVPVSGGPATVMEVNMAGSTKDVATKDKPADIREFSRETLARFAEMATLVPHVESDGGESILLAILNATDWDEVDAPWDKAAKDELIGKDMWIYGVHRRPSRFAGGLGVFLVARVKLLDEDKETVWTTSSVSCVGQLVKLHALNAFPVQGKIIRAEEPSTNGFYPEHLEIFASAGGKGPAARK